MLFTHPVLGFSFTFPDDWRVGSYLNPKAVMAYPTQTAADDLPKAGENTCILIAQEIVMAKDVEGVDYEQVPNHLEINIWRDQPFALPTRAKKFPLGALPFKARLGRYGNGGQHAAGQLDLGGGWCCI